MRWVITGRGAGRGATVCPRYAVMQGGLVRAKLRRTPNGTFNRTRIKADLAP